MPASGLPFARLDRNAMREGADVISVFCVMRNENARLPFWLQYYREMGVGQFFVVDNGSDDGGLEHLLTQPDCIVFQTQESFAAASYGTDWLNALLAAYGAGRWCLFVDMDELLVFAPAIGTGLKDLAKAVEAEGADGIFTLMVDMYPERRLADVNYVRGTPFWTQCRFFDRGPYQVQAVSECPYVNVIGGVRQRVFYPEYDRRTFVNRLRWRAGETLVSKPWFRNQGWVKNLRRVRPPVVSKVAMVRWREGARYISNAHTLTPVKLFSCRCALLHFKFFGDFHQKAMIEMQRGQHYDGAREYRRYFRFFAKNPDFSLTGPATARYDGPQSLADAGLLQAPGQGGDPVRFT